MLFNSIDFFLFLAVVFGLYWRLSTRPQNVLLLIGSYFFYGMWDYRFLALLAVSSVVDYYTGRVIHAAHGRGNLRAARLVLGVSLVVNLGILGFFKYWNFFVDSAAVLVDQLGIRLPAMTLEIVLPVGISFYTFQTLSYTIDIYRKRLEPARTLLDFLVFVAYFPQLVAGPIERACQLLPQIASKRQLRGEDLVEGFWLILIGMFRKVVVADSIAPVVDAYFKSPGSATSLELVAGLLLYSLQIYCDFSGYSNIAQGASRLFGIRLMRNFHHPYFATNISEFWRRWHISLSTWLRDYLFIPLGGSQGSRLKTFRNLFLTMFLGGLWHGAGWNFAIWGTLHGAYLGIYHVGWGRRPADDDSPSRMISVMGALAVFGLVTFTWLFFRSSDFQVTRLYLARLSDLSVNGWACLVPVVGAYLATLLIDLPQRLKNDELYMTRWPATAQGAAAGLLIACILLGGSGTNEPFIYFQF